VLLLAQVELAVSLLLAQVSLLLAQVEAMVLVP